MAVRDFFILNSGNNSIILAHLLKFKEMVIIPHEQKNTRYISHAGISSLG